MAFIRQSQPPNLSFNPLGVLLYLTHLPPIDSSPLAISSKMADESIYYMFSCRIPCLRESKISMYHFIAPDLTRHPIELQQQDRLVDSQVYLKVLNWREVRTTIQHILRPCPSATLLLASLLRVRVNLYFLRANSYPASLATCPQVSPSFQS
jgi:hypothetical protein